MTMTNWTTVALTTQAEAAVPLVLASESGGTTALSPSDAVIACGLAAAGWKPAPGRALDWMGEPGRRLVLGHGPIGGGPSDWLARGGHLVEAMRALRIASVGLPAASEIGGESLEHLLAGALLHGFRLDQGRAKAPEDWLALSLAIDPVDQSIADRAIAMVNPINRARAWVEQPANLLTPLAFAEEVVAALSDRGVRVRILDQAALTAIGAGGLLAVAQGSSNPPCMVVAEWRGAPEREGWDALLVGKGITFDGGGLNVKARPIIEKMKFDMGGAAAVLGALELVATRGAKANVAVVVPMAENTTGPAGYRPGDVIRMLSGQTAEVVNTDAEGRLVIADGITYGLREYDPRQVVDVATLTGAILGVLHEEYAGLYASNDALAETLLAAGEVAGEPLWRLPLTARQDYLVDSPVADVSNLGAPGFLGLGGGSPAAGAKFIERFTEGRSWAHIDIAGMAWATRRTPRSGPGATGFGVALLDRWIAGLETATG